MKVAEIVCDKRSYAHATSRDEGVKSGRPSPGFEYGCERPEHNGLEVLVSPDATGEVDDRTRVYAVRRA